jgi:hypothetical protein
VISLSAGSVIVSDVDDETLGEFFFNRMPPRSVASAQRIPNFRPYGLAPWVGDLFIVTDQDGAQIHLMNSSGAIIATRAQSSWHQFGPTSALVPYMAATNVSAGLVAVVWSDGDELVALYSLSIAPPFQFNLIGACTVDSTTDLRSVAFYNGSLYVTNAKPSTSHSAVLILSYSLSSGAVSLRDPFFGRTISDKLGSTRLQSVEQIVFDTVGNLVIADRDLDQLIVQFVNGSIARFYVRNPYGVLLLSSGAAVVAARGDEDSSLVILIPNVVPPFQVPPFTPTTTTTTTTRTTTRTTTATTPVITNSTVAALTTSQATTALPGTNASATNTPFPASSSSQSPALSANITATSTGRAPDPSSTTTSATTGTATRAVTQSSVNATATSQASVTRASSTESPESTSPSSPSTVTAAPTNSSVAGPAASESGGGGVGVAPIAAGVAAGALLALVALAFFIWRRRAARPSSRVNPDGKSSEQESVPSHMVTRHANPMYTASRFSDNPFYGTTRPVYESSGTDTDLGLHMQNPLYGSAAPTQPARYNNVFPAPADGSPLLYSNAENLAPNVYALMQPADANPSQIYGPCAPLKPSLPTAPEDPSDPPSMCTPPTGKLHSMMETPTDERV